MSPGMGVRQFSDLHAWQLCTELKRQVYLLTDSGPVMCDFGFRDQIRSAAASAPANIAEGFARFHHADFVRFLRIAIGSLDELENHLIDGIDRGHFVASSIDPLFVLRRRAAAASVALVRYLRNSQAP